MKTTLPPFVSRALAVLLLVAVLGSIWVLVGIPTMGRFAEYRDTVATAEQHLARLRGIAAEKPVLEQQLASWQRSGSIRQALLKGNNPALAAAELQKKIKRIIQSNGANQRSAQILPPKDDEGLQLVAIRVNMTASIEALHKIAYELEAAKPYLILDNVDIRARNTRPTQTKRAANQNVEKARELTVRFDVKGFMRGTAS